MILRTQSTTTPPVPLGDRRGPVVGAVVLLVAVAVAMLAGAKAALLFLGAASAARIAVPVVARLAAARNAVVLPGGRYAHAGKTPLLGGLAIAVPFVGYLAYEGTLRSLGLALGACLMAGVGAYDDLKGISPRGKVLGQALAAVLLVATGHRASQLLFAPWGVVPAAGVEVLLVVFWVVLVSNAINLIDGMDGLAATAALVAALSGAALGIAPLASVVLGGAILGFLRFNLPRAQIFLGDSGSLFLGFVTAALLLDGAGPVNVPVALGLVALPVGDAAISTLRRFLRGKPVFTGDRGHVHHRLLDAWKSPRRVLVFLGLFASAHALLAVHFRDLRALAGSAILWGGLALYLLGRTRPRWARILLDRPSFRRLHLSRQWAAGALGLARRGSDVRAVLARVAEDFGLVSLRVGSLRVERPSPPGVLQVEEHIDCGDCVASWGAAYEPADAVLAEEQRTILCDLLRLAHRRLLGIDGTVYRMPAPPSAPAAAPGRPPRPRVHFVVEGRPGLARVAPLVREVRARGLLEPLVVHIGPRDDLSLTDAQLRELGLEGPDVDLDVAPAEAIVLVARVMERYHGLLEVQRPAVVVVEDGDASVACALVAKEHGLAVARIAAPAEAVAPPGPLLSTFRGSLADLTIGREDPSEGDLTDLAPALEALLVA